MIMYKELVVMRKVLSVKCIIAFPGGGGNLRPNISIWREVSSTRQGPGRDQCGPLSLVEVQQGSALIG